MTTIYFDTCALNRLTDNPTQDRIRAEANAVEQALALVVAGAVRWITSNAVRAELSRNPDVDRREQVLPLLAFAHQELAIDEAVLRSASRLRVSGLGEFDALHLALCLSANVEYLLTVDDRFARRASRLQGGNNPQILSPVDWMARNTP